MPPDPIFKFPDTLSSRAGISDLREKFKDEVVAIIGVGGTGAYLLDLLVKTPVKEIWLFDLDHFHVHNAYRSPGKLEEHELGKLKAEVYLRRYEGFRHGLTARQLHVGTDSAAELAAPTAIATTSPPRSPPSLNSTIANGASKNSVTAARSKPAARINPSSL